MEQNIIIGTNISEFLLGTARSDFIVGEDGNDKIVARGDNDNLFGDFAEDLIFISDSSHLPVTLKATFGDDSIWGNKGDDDGSGDARFINFEFINNAVDKTVSFKFGNDCFYGGKGNDSFVGDTEEIVIEFDSGSESNVAIFHYGNDCIDLGDNQYGLQLAVGDLEALRTNVRSNNNTHKHYFGDDHIWIAATVIPPIEPNIIAAYIVNDIALNFNIKTISGDIIDANISITSELGTDSHLSLGSDKLKIGTIKSKIAVDTNGPSEPGLVGSNTVNGDTEIRVDLGLGIVTGDGAEASTLINESITLNVLAAYNEAYNEYQDGHQVRYDAGNDVISIAKATGSVIIGGDFANFQVGLLLEEEFIFDPQSIETSIIDSSDNLVQYYLGDDNITLKKTLSGEFDIPTIIFADAGQGSSLGSVIPGVQAVVNENHDPLVLLDPVTISISGNSVGNKIIYHDGDDKINVAKGKKYHHLGKGDQVIYSDTVYQIQESELSESFLAEYYNLSNEVTIIRGNDIMAGGKGADIFVFQVLELAENKWLGPGKDIVKDFNPYEGDMLRFITSTTDDGVQELAESIAQINVKHGNTVINFDDGSRIKLVDFNEGQASTEVAIVSYLDKLIDQNALEIFGLDNPIPLGIDIIPVA